jgi:hypothetical protein
LDTSLPPSWPAGRQSRRAKIRAGHTGTGEMPLRWAAGCALLAGICSLIVSQDRLPASSTAWPPFAVAGGDIGSPFESGSTRKPGMDGQDRTTLTAPPDVRTVGLSGEASDPSPERSGSQGVGTVTGLVGEGIARVEQVIRLYPWPTVLFGIGLGFVLARRMR